MRSARQILVVVGMALLLTTVAVAETHVGDWDVTGELTASGNFATFGDSSYVTPFSGWSGSSRMVAVRQPTAVSSGVSAGFMFSNNQTGNSQNIAQLMFLNEAIGVSEKRVAQILVQTGGTIDSGKMYFRVFNGGTGANALTINRYGTVTVGDGLTFPDGETQTTAFMGATGGGSDNSAGGTEATIGGGYLNTASGYRTTIAGGYQNEATAQYATVAGGNGNAASGNYSTVGSGESNTASGAHTTISGGYHNDVTDDYGTIGGGYNNQAGDAAGTTDDATYATVGGGQDNIASRSHATVGGGYLNHAGSSGATVGGGDTNTASGNTATISGGEGNTASGQSSTVGGGLYNTASGFCATVGGAYDNDAGGEHSTIGGGESNTASGVWATVPGGYANVAAGLASFAAGCSASASHDYSFVWGDDAGGTSAAANTFNVHASGGIYWEGGAVHTTSDRNKKENFEPVDPRAVLAKVAALPMSTWNYKTEDGGYRHMGPMGQDFHAAFGLGTDNKHITTVDADGVALAAIKGLYEVVQEKDAQIAAQQERIEALESKLEAVEALVSTLMEN